MSGEAGKAQLGQPAGPTGSGDVFISYASQVFTLAPGDLISTGTPEGVINGRPEAQQVWLKPGDKVACSVEKLGELSFDLS